MYKISRRCLFNIYVAGLVVVTLYYPVTFNLIPSIRIYLDSDPKATCKTLNPFSYEMTNFFRPYERNCSSSSYKQFYFKAHMTSGSGSYLITQFRRLPSHLLCCWEQLRFRNTYPYLPDNPDDMCVPFSKNRTKIPEDSEYIVIKCWNMRLKNGTIRKTKLTPYIQKELPISHYELLFFVAQPSREIIYLLDRLRRQKFPRKLKEKRLNVVILGFDTVSRANVMRLMPKTYAFLKSAEISAVDLEGFNKMGDATLNNTLAMMTGMDHAQALEIQRDPMYFDDLPWIWNNFTEHGYLTGYADDQLSVFDFRFNGFRKQPTDIYLHPLIKWYYKRIRKFGPHYDCIGNDIAANLLIDHAKKTQLAFGNHPYFQFLWNSRIHEKPGYISLIDTSILHLLQGFYHSGALNRTLLILTSDHGWRAGEIMTSRQARIENRRSFAFIILPKWFKMKYSKAYYNLLQNQHRLTTPYDLHATLLHILDTSKLENHRLQHPAPMETPFGISLFLPVPAERTCPEAGIDPEWCACTNFAQLSTKSQIFMATKLAKFAVSTLNSWLKSTSCVHYKLDKVYYAEVEVPEYLVNYSNPNINLSESHQFRIVFTVKPGGAQFEVTLFTESSFWLENDPGGITMSQEVFRLNLYGTQRCIDVYSLKKICTCKK